MHGTLRLYSKKKDEDYFLEVIWEINNSSAIEPKFLVKKSSIDLFILSWRSFLLRFADIHLHRINKTEIDNFLLKKATWLSNELHWSRISEQAILSLQTLTIISDPEFLTLPIELLPIRNSFLGDEIMIFRKIRSEYKTYTTKKLGKARLFVFENESKPNLSYSIENEANQIVSNIRNKENLSILVGKNIRESRFKEEISIAKTFHFAGHLEMGKFSFFDGTEITSDEISHWNLSHLELAFLNGCHSAFQSNEEIGLAAAFLNAGTKEVLGYSYGVPTVESELVGSTFWKTWEKTKSTIISFKAARDLLKRRNSPFRFTFYLFSNAKQTKSKMRNIFIGVVMLVSFLGFCYFSMAFIKNEIQKKEPHPLDLKLKKMEARVESSNSKLEKRNKTHKKDNQNASLKIMHNKRETLAEKYNIPNDIDIIPTQNEKTQIKSEWGMILAANHDFSESFQKIKSSSFQKKIKEFIVTPHPLLSMKTKIELTMSAINMKTSEEKMEFFFEKKIGEFK